MAAFNSSSAGADTAAGALGRSGSSAECDRLTHIVWWTLKPEAEGHTALENAEIIRKGLYALRGVVPSLKGIRLSLECLPSCTESVDLVLMTEHDNTEGLVAYAAHPEHRKVAEYIGKVATSRRALDFNCA